jgi:hypothetical protein
MVVDWFIDLYLYLQYTNTHNVAIFECSMQKPNNHVANSTGVATLRGSGPGTISLLSSSVVGIVSF